MSGICSNGQLDTCTVEPVIVRMQLGLVGRSRLRATYTNAAASTATEMYDKSEYDCTECRPKDAG